jgi:hypothetical protein
MSRSKRERARASRTPAPPASSALDVLDRIALGGLVLTSVALVGVFLVVSLSRITFPFELEWFEGLTIDSAYRIAHGLPIYDPADETYAPGFYPPLHYLVTLPFLAATGWSLFGARVVSWLAVAGCGIVTALVLRRSGRSWLWVVFALGAAAAFYPATGYWYDLARVDALVTFFAVAAVAALASKGGQPDGPRLWMAAALLVCAVATKQLAAPLAAAAVLYFGLARGWRRAAILVAALGVLGGGTAAALWLWTEGNIAIIFSAPSRHSRDIARLWTFGGFAIGLVPYLVVAVAGAVRDAPTRFFLVHTLAALGMAAVALMKIGGQTNSAMPAVFLLAITAGLAGEQLWRALGTGAAGRGVRLAGAAALTIAPWAWGAVPADVAAWIPSARDRADAAALWDDMARMPRDFLPYNYSFASTVLRGKTYPLADRLFDFAGGFDEETFWEPDVDRYPPALLAAIRAQRFAAIYTNGGGITGDPVQGIIREHYGIARVFGERVSTPRWKLCMPRVKFVPRPGAAE